MSEDKETEVVLEQVKRNLDHLRIDPVGGPEFTFGDVVLKFKKKAPVKALAALIGGADNQQVDSIIKYVTLCLSPGQSEVFDTMLDEIDIAGLGELLNDLTEAYSSFPEKS